ncbi:MAG: hypothetical protein FJW34_13475 [Acidobacteria bacterium]|nr:hypothetical protein [Acidobacteriota bacterium]
MVFCLLPSGFGLWPVAGGLLSGAFCLLPVACCLLPSAAFCRQPVACSWWPFASCPLPSALPGSPAVLCWCQPALSSNG